MRFHWPEGTVFRRLVLAVEQTHCGCCGRPLHVCGHRRHRLYTLQGPLELCCRRAHCPDRTCASRPHTLSPQAELAFALPGWLIGWDVFCWLGHRRFARHWSVPQLRDELSDTYRIHLSPDAIAVYLQRYQAMVAARQQDLALWRLAYRDIPGLWLSIDGLQPEKGHETLYAVRELHTQRVWFAEALLSSTATEVRRLLVRARDLAQELGQPVRLWTSDKQDAFVKGLAVVFPGVPHRYCSNHFLRDLAKPVLEKDSHAKVQMRKKVRGLREVEKHVLQERQRAQAATCAADAETPKPVGDGAVDAPAARASVPTPDRVPPVAMPTDEAGRVVLDYCVAVRGILNNDQGGPLQPPGLRMAQALRQVRASLDRNLALHKPGLAHQLLERLAGYMDRGLAAVRSAQRQVQGQTRAIRAVVRTLTPSSGTLCQRRRDFWRLQRSYQRQGREFSGHLARLMADWGPGLFVGVRGKQAAQAPADNLELERWFRLPKRHERKIHGRRHAGVRIVQEGPTLLLTLNAHEAHPEPFTAEELLPYRHAPVPAVQREALHRRKVMRKARSPKNARCCWQS
jgi:hypothetical protein